VHTATLTVPSRAEFVRPATLFLVHVARALNVSAAAEPVFEVALCEVAADEDAFTVRIIDDGSGFVMRQVGMPDVSPERIDAVPASGYGLPIIHTVFPSVRVLNVNGRFALELALPAAPARSRR
jgi:anti-sigma regulatory factor (Ser/Thr protein kinase)